jgi:cold shock CspA family protein
MMTGTIKRWISERAFGFIEVDSGFGQTDDVFVHLSACRCHPYEGLRVAFDLGSRNGKPCALNLQALKSVEAIDRTDDPPLDRGLARTLRT